MIENYDAYRDMLNACLIEYLPTVDRKSQSLQDAMIYSLQAGGKRLRPVLLLSSCEFAGGKSRDALPYACAAEYIHTYSLIHDDLPAMDDDDLRRGKATNHKVFGEGMAILAGDGLLHSAFEIMTQNILMYSDDKKALLRRIHAMDALAIGAGVRGMVAGQAADIRWENTVCSMDMLRYIHSNKTSAMIKASVQAGLYLGGAEEAMMEAMMRYADYLGFAFQIADDILDVVGKTEQLGKNTGQDQNRHKTTYASLLGVEAAGRVLHETTEKAVTALKPYGEKADFFRSLVRKLEARTH